MAEMIGAFIVLLIVCAVDKACPPPKNDSTNVVKGNPKRGGNSRRGRPCYRARRLPGDERHAELIAPNGIVVMTGTTKEIELQAKLRNKQELGIDELLGTAPAASSRPASSNPRRPKRLG